MGTNPSIQTKRSLLDVAPFMELETAGGVMTKLIEGPTCAMQADSQAGFSERFILIRRGLAILDARMKGFLTVAFRLASMSH